MGLYFKDKEISSVYRGNKAIVAIYKGAKLVWTAISSCFGKGYWINADAWDNQDGWQNNS